MARRSRPEAKIRLKVAVLAGALRHTHTPPRRRVAHLLHETHDHPPQQQHVERARQADGAVAEGAAQEGDEEDATARQRAVAQRPEHQPPHDLRQAVCGGYLAEFFRAGLADDKEERFGEVRGGEGGGSTPEEGGAYLSSPGIEHRVHRVSIVCSSI